MDVVSYQWIATGLLGLVIWFSKRTIDEQARALMALELVVQNIRLDYLHKNEFREFKVELRAMFEDLKRDLKEQRGSE